MRLFIFVLCLFCNTVLFGQNPKSAEIDYYDFDIMTVARIKPKTYDDFYYGKYNHVKIKKKLGLKLKGENNVNR